MLLEALCAVDYNRIMDDYMITYWNYFKFTQISDPDRYNTLVENLRDPMIQALFEEPDVDVTTIDLTEGAENYLKGIWMTSTAIDKLKARLVD